MSDYKQQYVLAIYYGSDGYSLSYFDTLEEAINEPKYGNDFHIFKTINYTITEIE